MSVTGTVSLTEARCRLSSTPSVWGCQAAVRVNRVRRMGKGKQNSPSWPEPPALVRATPVVLVQSRGPFGRQGASHSQAPGAGVGRRTPWVSRSLDAAKRNPGFRGNPSSLRQSARSSPDSAGAPSGLREEGPAQHSGVSGSRCTSGACSRVKRPGMSMCRLSHWCRQFREGITLFAM